MCCVSIKEEVPSRSPSVLCTPCSMAARIARTLASVSYLPSAPSFPNSAPPQWSGEHFSSLPPLSLWIAKWEFSYGQRDFGLVLLSLRKVYSKCPTLENKVMAALTDL